LLTNLKDAVYGQRVVVLGIAAIVGILLIGTLLLLANLPDANAFNARVERLFAESDGLTSPAEIRLLEILAQSGTAFSDTLTSYRVVILVLLIFAVALLVAALIFLLSLVVLSRRMTEVERAGISVNSLIVSRDEGTVLMNNIEFQLSEATCETLSILCEARLDGEVITGRDIEALASGRNAADCDDASGAMRIKRLRDQLGNQMIADLLVRNVTRKGYVLAIDKDAIKIV